VQRVRTSEAVTRCGALMSGGDGGWTTLQGSSGRLSWIPACAGMTRVSLCDGGFYARARRHGHGEDGEQGGGGGVFLQVGCLYATGG